MSLPSTVQVEVTDPAVTFESRRHGRSAHRSSRPNRSSRGLEPSLHGHSIGHWEGGTLVVDTVGYAAHPDGFAFDLPSSASKHIVERFTLAADRKHIDYEVVVEDPEYLARACPHRAQWDYRPEQQPSNLPCDTGVAGRFAESQ